MRVYTIKRKGATIWSNLMLDHEITFSTGEKLENVGLFFLRRKDAKVYLENSIEKSWVDSFRVVGMTIDKSKEDNRKRRKNNEHKRTN